MRSVLFIILCLSACAPFPALEGSVSDAARLAPYPLLQPLPNVTSDQPVTNDALNARIAALQARAARLRQIDIAALQ